jgi:uracil-DNA glycosylase
VTSSSTLSLEVLGNEIGECRKCERLVRWREQVADERRASYRDENYWGRGVPGFGDPEARILVVGLAPAAHGANRTGRMFTGDRSGDWLYGSLYRLGFATQPTSSSRGDGLELIDVWVTSGVRCAPPLNKPTPGERDNCLPFLRREMALLSRTRVVVPLGQFAYNVVAKELGVRPKPRFGHGVEVVTSSGKTVLCSYHPSQQNTFTGRLTEAMLDAIWERAKVIVASGS